MNYAFWADTTAVIHFLTIVAVIIGLLISFRYKRFRPWEAGLLITIFILWSYYGNCPLTLLEQYLRDQAGQQTNITSIGWSTYYAQKLFGLDVPSRFIQQTTFFSGAMFFGASIEWFSPFFHREVFKLRRFLKHLIRKWA
ncbi:MAG: DUF2784 family protein [Candidatus Zambryskibacteria bacterium]|nr:DUF2784 family protein [Candidatus Zambryskibacteria bacterium]